MRRNCAQVKLTMDNISPHTTWINSTFCFENGRSCNRASYLSQPSVPQVTSFFATVCGEENGLKRWSFHCRKQQQSSFSTGLHMVWNLMCTWIVELLYCPFLFCKYRNYIHICRVKRIMHNKWSEMYKRSKQSIKSVRAMMCTCSVWMVCSVTVHRREMGISLVLFLYKYWKREGARELS